MVYLGKWQQYRVTLSVKPNCLTLSLEGPADSDVFSYDYAGRLWTAYIEGVSYRRGLDGKMVAKWQVGEERNRHWLGQEQALEVETKARQITAHLWADLQSGKVALSAPLVDRASQGFARLLAFDAARSRQDATLDTHVYRPVGILPPD